MTSEVCVEFVASNRKSSTHTDGSLLAQNLLGVRYCDAVEDAKLSVCCT